MSTRTAIDTKKIDGPTKEPSKAGYIAKEDVINAMFNIAYEEWPIRSTGWFIRLDNRQYN